MMTYLIIDDEHIAHDVIKNYCDQLGNMKLLKHCYDALEALEFLRNNQVDLIFLDLNMPKLKGFDFLRSLPNPPKVIVTTAYQQHALEGYELNIVDYLLKPFSFERFLKAINKTTGFKTPISHPTPEQNTGKETLFFYSDKKHIQVKVNEILFVEAAGNYCKVVMEDNQLLVREKISDVLEMLSAHVFIKVHKSFIVSKTHIESIEGNRIQIKEHKIPVGKIYKTRVLDLLK
tara:strand:- start:2369 stop:3064 length:696 start_codon:yes stop_codon:yes gene_type:complete